MHPKNSPVCIWMVVRMRHHRGLAPGIHFLCLLPSTQLPSLGFVLKASEATYNFISIRLKTKTLSAVFMKGTEMWIDIS